jgi:RsiW-degrading membrane proteinase PrsW (M82 family)
MPRQLAQRALQTLSWTGLAVSLLIFTFSAPRLLELGGGAGVVFGNVAQHAWTIALLLLVFAWTRTIGLRALAGAALAGFFGVASLAVLIGKPLVGRFGSDSPFVPLFFAPVTEELLKLMPVALFLLLAARSRRWRPSVGDAVLFGFTVASGFAIYEDILYARGTGGGWLAALPLSSLLPSITSRGPMLVGGHAVYTGLASLGLAVTIIYWNRFRVARLALPLTLALVMIEHGTANALGTIFILFGMPPPPWAQLVLTFTLHGALSSLLFVTGVAAVAVLETRLVMRGGARLPKALRIRDVVTSLTASPRWASLAQLARRLRYETLRRSAILAVAQSGDAAPDADATAAVVRSYGDTGLAIGTSA